MTVTYNSDRGRVASAATQTPKNRAVGKQNYRLNAERVRRSTVVTNWKTWSRRILTWVTVAAVILVLLGWGTYALQWTTPSNNLGTVTLHRWNSYGFEYRIPPGEEQDFRLRPDYPSQSPSPNQVNTVINESKILGYIDYSLHLPSSTPWSYTVNYVIMTFNSNQTYSDIDKPIYREIVWYTGPQGNLTALPLSGGDAHYFEITAPANYTIHIFNPLPPEAYLNATGTATLGLSKVVYTRPYYNLGLITIGVAGAFTAVFPAFTAYDFLKRRRRDNRKRIPESPQ